jgi:hypothetical protein
MTNDELIARATKRYLAKGKRKGLIPTQPSPTLSTVDCPDGSACHGRLLIKLRNSSEIIGEYHFYPASNRLIYVSG